MKKKKTYQYKVQLPPVTFFGETKTSKRKMLLKACEILWAEINSDSLYRKSKGEFKVKEEEN